MPLLRFNILICSSMMCEEQRTKETRWKMAKAVFAAVSLPDPYWCTCSRWWHHRSTPSCRTTGRADTRKLAMSLLQLEHKGAGHTLSISQSRTDDATHCRLLIGKHPIQSGPEDQMFGCLWLHPNTRAHVFSQLPLSLVFNLKATKMDCINKQSTTAETL
jgi:hypothetical protein